ncbi:hypothetical protein GN316_20230 [Xylophilus sp. Kf1]|nr:hypothetical protein [Xylophilus sp. Kf1]
MDRFWKVGGSAHNRRSGMRFDALAVPGRGVPAPEQRQRTARPRQAPSWRAIEASSTSCRTAGRAGSAGRRLQDQRIHRHDAL